MMRRNGQMILRNSKTNLLMPYQKRALIKSETKDPRLEKHEFWHDLVFSAIRNVLSACALGVLGLVIIGFKWKTSSETWESAWYVTVGAILAASSFFLVVWAMSHSLLKWKSNADFKISIVNVVIVLVLVSAMYVLATPMLYASLQTTIENIKTKSIQEKALKEQEDKLEKIFEIVSAEKVNADAPKRKKSASKWAASQ